MNRWRTTGNAPVADGSTAKTSPLTRRRTSARTLTRSFARTLVLIATLAFGLAFGAVTASGWTLSRSTLTEAQIRAGEINCVIMERAFAHGFTSAQIPETASACRIYSLSLRRP